MPVCLVIFKIARQAVNLPFYDEWFPHSSVDVALAAAEHRLTLHDLLAQNFEHRIFFTHLTTALLARFGLWDLRVQMLLSVALAGLTGLLLLLLLRRLRPSTWTLWLLPVSFLLFSLRQQNNWLWGFQDCWYFAEVFLTASIFALVSPQGPRALPAALLASCALFSLGSGILAIPIGLLILLFRARGNLRSVVLYSAITGTALALFFRNYTRASASPQLHQLQGSARYLLVFLGGPFVEGEGVPLSVGAVAGALCLLLFLSALLQARREPSITWLPWVAVGAYGLGSGVLVALSSRGAALTNALYGRYVTNSSFLAIGAVGLTAVSLGRTRSVAIRIGWLVAWLPLAILFALASFRSWPVAPFLATARQQECALEAFRSGEFCFDPTTAEPARELLLFQRLAAAHLSVFGHAPAKFNSARRALILDPARTEDWGVSPGRERGAPPTGALGADEPTRAMTYLRPLSIRLGDLKSIEIGTDRREVGQRLSIAYALDYEPVPRTLLLSSDADGRYVIPVESLHPSSDDSHLTALQFKDIRGQSVISSVAFVLKG